MQKHPDSMKHRSLMWMIPIKMVMSDYSTTEEMGKGACFAYLWMRTELTPGSRQSNKKAIHNVSDVRRRRLTCRWRCFRLAMRPPPCTVVWPRTRPMRRREAPATRPERWPLHVSNRRRSNWPSSDRPPGRTTVEPVARFDTRGDPPACSFGFPP